MVVDVIWWRFLGKESSWGGWVDSIGGGFEGGESEEEEGDEEEESTYGDGGLGSGDYSLGSTASSNAGGFQ